MPDSKEKKRQRYWNLSEEQRDILRAKARDRYYKRTANNLKKRRGRPRLAIMDMEEFLKL